jgi:DNA-directed RNA polymerase subunit M/transcription elongation factor TFIIS
MPVIEKTVKKQCPNCGTINEFPMQVNDESQDMGSTRVTCKSCNWKWKITVPGLVTA